MTGRPIAWPAEAARGLTFRPVATQAAAGHTPASPDASPDRKHAGARTAQLDGEVKVLF
jgi:hypothetical protein